MKCANGTGSKNCLTSRRREKPAAAHNKRCAICVSGAIAGIPDGTQYSHKLTPEEYNDPFFKRFGRNVCVTKASNIMYHTEDTYVCVIQHP